MTTTALVPINEDAKVAAVEDAVARARAQAEAIEVRSEAEANAATEVLKAIKSQRGAFEAERKELVGPLNATVKRINQRFKDALAPYDEADGIVREKVTVYQAEQERIRREEEARLEAERLERERIAREERERQEAKARAKREAAEKEAREAQELADAEAHDAEMAQLAEEAREKAQEAATAEAAIESLPEPTLPKAVVPSAPKLNGASTRMVWKVKLIVLPLLPDDYKIADEKAINAAMRDGVRENGEPPEIPGVEFEQVAELAVRS